jgi:hypothetical protein
LGEIGRFAIKTEKKKKKVKKKSQKKRHATLEMVFPISFSGIFLGSKCSLGPIFA